jgi:peroxiredoxin
VLLAVCVIVPVALVLVALSSSQDDGGDGNDGTQSVVRTVPGLEASNPVTAGDVAPTFRLRTLDGDALDTARYRGKPYVLTFWGSWCIPCRKEMPLLDRAFEQHDGTLHVVGVTFQDPESESRKFVEKYGITFPIAPDDGYRIAKTFGVTNVPVTFFVGADGKVVERVAGTGNTKDLEQALAKLT